MELKQVVLVGGQPKGHDSPFHPDTLSGKRLRHLLAETGLGSAKLFDLWTDEDEETKGDIDPLTLDLLKHWVSDGALVESLGRWVQSRLCRAGIVTGYLPHPAARRPSDLKLLERGLKRLRLQRWPKLPRIWFKAEMKKAVLEGRKTATTRGHQKKLGDWLAVTGSRYDPVPFAVLRITENAESTWANSLGNFEVEGFTDRAEMERFVADAGLAYSQADRLYFHRFQVVLKD